MKKHTCISAVIVFNVIVYFCFTFAFGGNITKDAVVLIPNNSTFPEVVNTISPYLKNEMSFKLASYAKDYHNNVKSGRFSLKKGLSNLETIEILSKGKQTPVRIIFNNVETIKDLSIVLSKSVEESAENIFKAFYDEEFLKKYNLTKETVISIPIPNTYEVFWNVSADRLVKRLYRENKIFWNESRLKKAKDINLTPLQVSTLASIVQKETSNNDEKRIVAGVFLNRLKKGLRLESCPTVIFAVKQKDGKDIRRVLYKHLKIDSPFNTYENKGLPPSPICITEISSIDAVLNAEKHDYIYMCVDPNRLGYHAFAKSLREHNKNKSRFIRWRKGQ
ncbi:endolytic transglycosylase MltG [Ichthyobacterium seriolicida]|uniref:Endolytic murein transglycosylase n=1 Tax=Ichthyobacterium seriolicida TaxID=242600 RepID=A0A1J1DXC9_9FLAO|nr:endolytic transglycosylase MltG [Ichthyobacterium seriolicida]BAV94511.1 aminodeoxychorismate lyase [Ichthyobacterium seriolicida]